MATAPTPFPNQTLSMSGTHPTAAAPGANAPSGAAVGPANQLFGDPSALQGGAAGKTGITQGPQLSLGAKGQNSLTNTGSGLASVSSQLGGAK